jgi:flagellar motor component MotA
MSVTGAGALVGTTIGAVAGQVVVTPSASDLLTGEGRLIVEYTYDQ